MRVVEIGGPWSRELCGGTHVQHSSQIGALTVTGESSVGSGVRRVEAFVGMDALRYLAKERALVAELTELVKVQPGELKERVAALVARVKDAEREIEKMRREQVRPQTGKLLDYARDVRGIRVLTHDAGDVREPTTCAPWPWTCATASATRAPRSWPSPEWPRAVRRWSSRPTPPARERGIKAGALVRVSGPDPRRRRRRQGRPRPGRRHGRGEDRRGTRARRRRDRRGRWVRRP